ncbi:MAG: tRNA pseudouridine(13) synthase TruD [Methylococcaceae bacterium]|nr:tRNA pseudouridine(13) synthase TruD [Methylococcaceae bacterium]
MSTAPVFDDSTSSRVAPLPYAHGTAPAKGTIKSQPEDFIVEEVLGFEPSGSGEHAFLRIQKKGENTDFLARQIAKFAGVPRSVVSYAGLKDRHGVTVQWFSVQLPGKAGPDWAGLNSDTITVLEATRNDRKLKKGALRGNRFHLVIRDLEDDAGALGERLQRIAADGVPNYFGPQRFGRNGGNLDSALAMFRGEFVPRDRHLRGIYLSAARSFLFNAVLAQRVKAGNWNQAIPGDVFMFPDSHSFFSADLDERTLQRVADQQIHPSGPLWGKGDSPAQGDALALEQAVAGQYREFADGLEAEAMEPACRPLRLIANDLRWSLNDAVLELSFSLPAGAYATTLLREAIDFAGELD